MGLKNIEILLVGLRLFVTYITTTVNVKVTARIHVYNSYTKIVKKVTLFAVN